MRMKKVFMISMITLIQLSLASTIWAMEYNASKEQIQKRLYTALEQGSLPKITQALEQGADPNKQIFNGHYNLPALAYAGTKLTPAIVTVLMRHGANVNQLVKYRAHIFAKYYKRSAFDYSILSWLCTAYRFDFMLDALSPSMREREEADNLRASIRMIKNLGTTLKWSIESHYPRELKGIILHILNAKEDQLSQLIDSIDKNDTETIETVLSSNLHLANQIDSDGKTPFYYVLVTQAYPNPKVVDLLLKNGANSNKYMSWEVGWGEPERGSEMPLNVASNRNLSQIVDLLLANGIDQYHRAEWWSSAPIVETTDHNTRIAFARHQCQVTSDGEILCPICYQDLCSKIIMTRRCGHIFCHECELTLAGGDLSKGEKGPCPMCGDQKP